MKKRPDIRRIEDMKKVLYDKEWAKKANNFELYYMYRGLKIKKDLRFDITVIPSRMLGEEFVKTKGHNHLNNYKELYIIIEGEAIYLMQKTNNGKVEDVYAVKTKKGNAVIIPYGYGHVTINPSKKDLKMANWISKKCKSGYSLFEKKQGACYYYTKSGWVKNKRYKETPPLRFEKPLKSAPSNLDFLITKAGVAEQKTR
ncbi:MAG: glucose-6-phosphate isomerase family protein [Candidatus Pacebacteria bacterium]|nr:glucose-6-phosphate isomerase family protein [Candidatus Paceibacterota bacterium]